MFLLLDLYYTTSIQHQRETTNELNSFPKSWLLLPVKYTCVLSVCGAFSNVFLLTKEKVSKIAENEMYLE